MGKALVGRVIDGNAELLQPDVERVIGTWFAPVSGVNIRNAINDDVERIDGDGLR